MPMKPTPMPMKTGKPKKPIMLPRTGMAYGGMTDKLMKRPMAMGMAKGGMTNKGKK
jgi:hypothetical protein